VNLNPKAKAFLDALKAHTTSAHRLASAWEQLDYEISARGGNHDVAIAEYPHGLPDFAEHANDLDRWSEAVEARIAEAVK
jgi:hypothetical protein